MAPTALLDGRHSTQVTFESLWAQPTIYTRACLATWENFPQQLMSKSKFSVKENPMTTVDFERHVSGIHTFI